VTAVHDVRPGDTIEVRGIPGAPTRRGVIREVLGVPEHEHYLVRWDEQHESLFFPGAGEGVHTVHPRRRGRQPASSASADHAAKQER
jgi:hypothetical protein